MFQCSMISMAVFFPVDGKSSTRNNFFAGVKDIDLFWDISLAVCLVSRVALHGIGGRPYLCLVHHILLSQRTVLGIRDCRITSNLGSQ